MKGEKGARTDRRAARLRWFGSKNLPSVLFILPIFLCLSSFLFFFFPLFVLVELICSVHVTKIRPLHVCLSPILPSLPRDYWPEQPVQKVAVVGLIPIPLCGTRMEKNNPRRGRRIENAEMRTSLAGQNGDMLESPAIQKICTDAAGSLSRSGQQGMCGKKIRSLLFVREVVSKFRTKGRGIVEIQERTRVISCGVYVLPRRPRRGRFWPNFGVIKWTSTRSVAN